MPTTKNTNLMKKLMNTRRAASKTIPKGVATIKNAMNALAKTPYNVAKGLNRLFGGKRSSLSGKRRTRRAKKARKTRRHH